VTLGQPEPGRSALEEVIRARVAALPAPACRLLEVIAVAGHPVALGIAQAVAGLEAEEDPAVGLLRAARLVRTRRTEVRSEIETYHDRIREAVTAHLPPETLRLYHARLARGLEAAGGADPETLATHFRQAGYREEAAAYAVRGAEQAAQALAFDRAAELYRLALELAPPEPAEARALRVKLADALANAGRGAVAGEAYLRAAEARRRRKGSSSTAARRSSSSSAGTSTRGWRHSRACCASRACASRGHRDARSCCCSGDACSSRCAGSASASGGPARSAARSLPASTSAGRSPSASG
jgi:hypothetical protein